MPFDEHVVARRAAAIHADPDRVSQQQAGERRTGELAALVGIEDLRSTVSGERLSSGSRQRCDRLCRTECGASAYALDVFEVAPGNRNKTAPALPQHGVCSARSNWESSSCSPSSGAARGSGPAAMRRIWPDLRDPPESARSGRSNSRLDQTNEHRSEGINVCGPQCVRLIHDRPSEGETINASHKAILTVPSRQGTWPTSRYPKIRRSISSAGRSSKFDVAQRLARRRIGSCLRHAWSLWRRAHQAVAQKSHLKQKSQLQCLGSTKARISK